jgi:ATP-dependent protease Clp ATPase subunit
MSVTRPKEMRMKTAADFVKTQALRLGWEKSALFKVTREAKAKLRGTRMLRMETSEKVE